MNISPRNAVLIFNPAAGQLKNGGERLIRRAAERLTAAGFCVSTRATPGPNQAAAIARDAIAEGASLIVAVGGDGTINEVASGMIGSIVPLLALPAGTANVLANEIGFTSDLDHALDLFPTSIPRRIAAGRVSNATGDTRHFLLMTGVGLDARVVASVNPQIKRRFGKIAYWLGGFSQIGRPLDEFNVEVNGRQLRASFALATRVRNYGGDLEIARHVRLLDPDFELVLFGGDSALRYVKYLAGVALNTLYGMDGVTIVRASSVRFAPTNGHAINMHTDGESFGCAPGSIEIVPDALTLLVPPAYGA